MPEHFTRDLAFDYKKYDFPNQQLLELFQALLKPRMIEENADFIAAG